MLPGNVGYNLHTFIPREVWGWAQRQEEGRRILWTVEIQTFEGTIHWTDSKRTEEAAIKEAKRWLKARGYVLPAPGPDLSLVGEVVRRVEKLAREKRGSVARV